MNCGMTFQHIGNGEMQLDVITGSHEQDFSVGFFIKAVISSFKLILILNSNYLISSVAFVQISRHRRFLITCSFHA